MLSMLVHASVSWCCNQRGPAPSASAGSSRNRCGHVPIDRATSVDIASADSDFGNEESSPCAAKSRVIISAVRMRPSGVTIGLLPSR